MSGDDKSLRHNPREVVLMLNDSDSVGRALPLCVAAECIEQLQEALRVALGESSSMTMPEVRALAAPSHVATPQIDAMVDRFLAWKLPKDFQPDGGISFKPSVTHPESWPIGTNLLTAVQARAMLEHIMASSIAPLNVHSDEEACRNLAQRMLGHWSGGPEMLLGFLRLLLRTRPAEQPTPPEGYRHELVKIGSAPSSIVEPQNCPSCGHGNRLNGRIVHATNCKANERVHDVEVKADEKGWHSFDCPACGAHCAADKEAFGVSATRDTERLDHVLKSLHIDATQSEPIFAMFVAGVSSFLKGEWDGRKIIDASMAATDGGGA